MIGGDVLHYMGGEKCGQHNVWDRCAPIDAEG